MAHFASITRALDDGTACLLRSATGDDAAAITAHNKRLSVSSEHNVSQPHEALPTEEDQRKRIAKAIASPTHLTIVAVDPVKPDVIVAAIEFHGHKEQRIAHHGTFGIGVDKAHRSNGLGRLLIQLLLDWALADETIEKVSLGVFETNTGARRLYSSIGFVEEIRQHRFFKLSPGQYVDDIGMTIYTQNGVAPEGFKTWRGSNVESQLGVTKNGS